jgi:UDP:flavonoid glycosyltransferase YjiC (YdhE family)
MFDEVIGRHQADWPPRTVQTGACLYTNDRDLSAEQQARLEKFLNLDHPPVIVTLGSSAVHCPGDFFSDCSKILESLNLRGLFISGKNEVGCGTTDERRFMQIDYAPYSQVFGAAKAVVSHGGIGTLSQVLRAGKPMLVVPFAHDQPDNADRIQKLGMGLALPIEKFTVSRAGRFLKRLISEHQFAECATNLMPHLVADGAARAANAVVSLTI